MAYIEERKIEKLNRKPGDSFSQLLYAGDFTSGNLIFNGIECCGQIKWDVADDVDQRTHNHRTNHVEDKRNNQGVELIGRQVIHEPCKRDREGDGGGGIKYQ